MNCIEARRCVLVQPAECPAEVTNHLRLCTGCSSFAGKAVALDRRISRAMAVPVPWNLSSHVAATLLAGHRRQRRHFLAFAAAASAVALGAGLTAVLMHDDPEALAGIDFVVDEEAHAILAAGPSDPSALARLADRVGIRLSAQLGDLRYIGTCPFMGAIAHHIVATTPYGKVTLLVVPDRRVDRRKSAHARGLRALVCPARQGCFAIVGESARGVARAAEMVLAS